MISHDISIVFTGFRTHPPQGPPNGALQVAIWRLGILEALRRSMAYLALLATYASRCDHLTGGTGTPLHTKRWETYGLMGFNGDVSGVQWTKKRGC